MANENNRDDKNGGADDGSEKPPSPAATNNDLRSGDNAPNERKPGSDPQEHTHNAGYHASQARRSDLFKTGVAVAAAGFSLISAISSWRSANGSNASADTASAMMTYSARPTLSVEFPATFKFPERDTEDLSVVIKNAGPGPVEVLSQGLAPGFFNAIADNEIVEKAPDLLFSETYGYELNPGMQAIYGYPKTVHALILHRDIYLKQKPKILVLIEKVLFRDAVSDQFTQEFCMIYKQSGDVFVSSAPCTNHNGAPLKIPAASRH